MSRHASEPLVLGVLWGLAVLSTGLLAIFAPDRALPAGQTIQYGYGQVFATIGVLFLSAIALPVGFLGAQLSAMVAYRRASRGSKIED